MTPTAEDYARLEKRVAAIEAGTPILAGIDRMRSAAVEAMAGLGWNWDGADAWVPPTASE